MKHVTGTSLGVALALGAAVALAVPRHLLVFCSPGSPGSTAEAQPTMDAFAAAVAVRAALPGIGAEYGDTEDAGVRRIRAADAAVAVVSLPFFLKHERELGLRARLQPVPKGRDALERWALVAKRGRVASPSDLAGYTIASSAGFAPAFVAGPALGAWGAPPAGARIVASSAILSSLRRAASGEKVAVLLDGAQDAALAGLPFASELEVVVRSAPVPVAIVAVVGDRLSAKGWSALAAALTSLGSDPAGARALEAVQLTRFAPVDEDALGAAHRAYAGASR